MDKETQTAVEINGMEVIAEVVNTKQEFKWRLRSGEETSYWSKAYDSLLVYRFKNGRMFALATDYWNGTLPIEVPFEIVQG